MKKNVKLSIIVLAGNEQEMIKDCLSSCNFADQLIVVLANSTDSTENITKTNFPQVEIIKTNDESNKNYSKWRNLGLSLVKNSWCLYVDADERLTPMLIEEIKNTLSLNPKFSHYVIPRANYFLGKRVKFGGTYPDYVKRLYHLPEFKGYSGILHEEPIISGNFSFLKNDILHYTHRYLDTMLIKTNAWTDLQAENLYQSNHPPVYWWRFFRMMLWKGYHRLIIEKMWRDGFVGWLSVIFETFDTFIIYAKLWELQHYGQKSRHLRSLS